MTLDHTSENVMDGAGTPCTLRNRLCYVLKIGTRGDIYK